MSTTPTDAERAQLIERLKNHGRLGHRSIAGDKPPQVGLD